MGIFEEIENKEWHLGDIVRANKERQEHLKRLELAEEYYTRIKKGEHIEIEDSDPKLIKRAKLLAFLYKRWEGVTFEEMCNSFYRYHNRDKEIK